MADSANDSSQPLRSFGPASFAWLTELKLGHGKDGPASASLCDASARHPSPAIMSEGWWTRTAPVGTAPCYGCGNSRPSVRSHESAFVQGSARVSHYSGRRFDWAIA